MKTSIYPYDIFTAFSFWPDSLLNWWTAFDAEAVTSDVKQTPFEYKLKIEHPQIRKKDLKVNVHNGVLWVEGQRKKSTIGGKTKHHVHFKKSYVLPDTVDENNIKASFRNGKLTVVMPRKKKHINYRSIPVEGKEPEARMLPHDERHGWMHKTGNRLKLLFKKAA